MNERREARAERVQRDHVATLTATVDQLQAELERQGVALVLLLGAALGLTVLSVALELRVRRLAR